MENKKHYFSNGEITVVWESQKCEHSGNCVNNSPNVFQPCEKPWIQLENATTEEIIETIKKCPSGALEFYWNEGEE